jgi:hypothetical protein
MNRRSCKREEQTSAAIVSGLVDPEIVAHAQGCSACSDILLIGAFLRNESTLADQERIALPSPELIWRKAQHRATQRAVRLALRPIRVMTVLACIAFACSPWLRLVLPIFQDLTSSSAQFLGTHLVSVFRIWPGAVNEAMMLLGASGTMVLLGLSSWLMLRQE